MRRNNRTITGLETPLKKVLHCKLEKYILIESMINIRKLFTNNFRKFVLIHSDIKNAFRGGTKNSFFAEDGGVQFSKLVNFATRNLRQPQTQLETRLADLRSAFAGRVCMSYTNKQKKTPLARAAGSVYYFHIHFLPTEFSARYFIMSIWRLIFQILRPAKFSTALRSSCKRQILRFAARRTTTLWI